MFCVVKVEMSNSTGLVTNQAGHMRPVGLCRSVVSMGVQSSLDKDM